MRRLAQVAAVLCAMHLLVGWLWLGLDRMWLPGGATFVRMFHLDRESNLPALFSTLLIAGCALLSWLAARTSEPELRTRFGWWVCAVVFGYLAIDEASALHESLSLPMRRSFELGGPLFFAWVVPASAFVLLFLAVQARFLFNVEPGTRSGMILAGMLYVSGALGMEMVGGWLVQANSAKHMQYVLLVLVEEGLEMAGMIVLCGTLLRHLADDAVAVSVRFREGGPVMPRAEDLEPIGDVRLAPAPKGEALRQAATARELRRKRKAG